MRSRGESFIFRDECGCAFGLADVRPYVATEDAAWKAMFDTAAERKAAKARGVYVTREAWENYRHTVYDQLSPKWQCPHAAVAS